MTGFGEKLKRERETRGFTLEDVAQATRVRRCHLEALEADNFEELPGTVFNKGYVRAYANFIGADPESLIEAYLAEELAQHGGVELEQQDVLSALSRAVDRVKPREVGGPVARHLLSRLIVPTLVFGGLALAGWFLFRDLPPNEQASQIARRSSPSRTVVEPVRNVPPTSGRERPLAVPPPPKAVPAKRDAATPKPQPAEIEGSMAGEPSREAKATRAGRDTPPTSTAENPLLVPLPPKAVPTKRDASAGPSKPKVETATPSEPLRAARAPQPAPVAKPAVEKSTEQRAVSEDDTTTATVTARTEPVVEAPREATPVASTRTPGTERAVEPLKTEPRTPSPPTVAPTPTKTVDEPVAQVTRAERPVVVSNSHLSIRQYGVGTKVVNRQLAGRSDRFKAGGRVYFWTNVSGGRKGDRIRHVWLYKGATIQSNRLGVGATTWRTHSYKTMTLSRLGPWAVEARDADGNVLARESFVCVK